MLFFSADFLSAIDPTPKWQAIRRFRSNNRHFSCYHLADNRLQLYWNSVNIADGLTLGSPFEERLRPASSTPVFPTACKTVVRIDLIAKLFASSDFRLESVPTERRSPNPARICGYQPTRRVWRPALRSMGNFDLQVMDAHPWHEPMATRSAGFPTGAADRLESRRSGVVFHG